MLDNTEDFMSAFADLDVKNLEVTEDLTPIVTEVIKKDGEEETEEEKQIAIEAENAKKLAEENTSTKDDEVIEPTIYSGIVNLVKEEAGLFSSFEADKITDANQLVEAIKGEITEGIEDYKNSLPEELKHIVENYEAGVSLRDLIELQSNEVELDSITSEDLEDKDLQKRVYTQYLKSTTRFSDSKIEKEINKLDDLDELGDESKNALEELKELSKVQKEEVIAKAKEDKLAYDKSQKEQLENLKKDVTSTKEIIPGVILHEKDQVTLFKQMTQPVAFDRQGNPISRVQEIRAKDPIAFEKTLNYLVMKGVFENDYSLFKSVEAKGKTKAVTELEKLAAKTVNNKERGVAAKIAGPLEETMLNALG
jgi:hypothetical protein